MIALPHLKQAASEILPASLYKQLEPHLSNLICAYEGENYSSTQLNKIKDRYERQRYKQLRENFKLKALPEKHWNAYATRYWPDIDQCTSLGNDFDFAIPF